MAAADKDITARQVMAEFINLYKKNTCLWDARSEDFGDKEKRQEAYNELLQKYKELQDDACILEVKRKLDNMKTSYRREYKKVLKSIKYGGKKHIPNLWYYELMTFLSDTKATKKGGSVPSTVNENSRIDIEFESETEQDSDEPVTVKIERTNDDVILPKQQQRARKRKLSESNEIIPTIYLSQQHDDIDYGEGEENMTDKRDSKGNIGETASKAFGRTVGLQLNELDPLQKMIAEKLISDVIFHARLQKLTVSTCIYIPEH